jgi:hypothetical protein
MPDSDDIKIDKSVKYKVNAGQCDKCGYFKTWDTRIKNPKTKKSMPAHVTEEGHLVNGGECPYWTHVKATKGKQLKDIRNILDGEVKLDDIIKAIVHGTDLTRDDVEKKLKESKEKTKGLLTDIGAAIILADSLGITDYNVPVFVKKQTKTIETNIDMTIIVDAINNGFAAVVKEIKNLTTEINTLTTVTETRNARLKQIQEMIKDKHVIRYDDLLAKCKEPKENKDSKDSKDGKDSKVDKEDKKTKKGK